MADLMGLLLHENEWTLTSVDTQLSIKGQFVPTDLTESISANYATTPTVGREVPLMQYVGGSGTSYKFTAKAWAYSQGLPAGPLGIGVGAQTIEDFVDSVRSTVRVNPDIGRPEIFTFQVGKSIEVPLCVVTSVGGIRYDRLRPSDGTLRGVTFQIELSEFVEYPMNLSASVAESLVLTARGREAYEHLAVRAYGDATAGEALRRRNPEKVPLTTGDVIHAPPKARLLRGFKPTPQSIPLRASDANAAARSAYFKSRDRDFHLITVTW